MSALRETDPVTRMLREKLKIIFPVISENLSVSVWSRKDEEDEWHLESRCTGMSDSMKLKIFAEYIVDNKIPDSRIGEWGSPKIIKWVISVTELLEQNLGELERSGKAGLEPVRYFFNRVLKELSKGLIDCKMFEQMNAEDNIVLNHIFSGVPKMSDLLLKCVETLACENGLPDPSLLTQLSAELYEKRPVHGSILFLRESDWEKLKQEAADKENYDIISLEEVKDEQRKLNIDNMRFLRKLAEMNSDEASVVIMKTDVKKDMLGGWIIVGMISNQRVLEEDHFWLDFRGQLKWAVRKKQTAWFTYRDGSYRYSAEESLEENYKQKIYDNAADNPEKLIQIVELLKKESHGTAVVFMENGSNQISEEVKRFFNKNRCVKLSEDGIDLEGFLRKMRGVTAIDGALLADFSGNCYAIGVIFDGEAMIEGQVSRGARYNSVANYVQVVAKKYENKKVIGVIVSEDGGVVVKTVEPDECS